MNLQHIDHIAITVKDVEKSIDWYKNVLGMERRYEDVWGLMPAIVAVGATSIALFPDSENEVNPHPLGFRHIAFRTDREGFTSAQSELLSKSIPFNFEDHEASHSIYFKDPDGYLLEITTYEI